MTIMIIPLVTLCAQHEADQKKSVLVPPGQCHLIEQGEGQRLIERGLAQLAGETETPSTLTPKVAPKVTSKADVNMDSVIDSIVDVIAELPNTAYGKDGKPKVSAIQSILAIDVTANQRDQAWAAFQALSQTP